MATSVRELPPLRLSVLSTAPSGQTNRWAWDEPKPDNTPSGIHFSSSQPGGFADFDCTLPRQSQKRYSDLDRLSNICVMGVGGQIAWEGRLEKIPRQSGDQVGVNPQAVGWQAHLDDDNSAKEIYIDRDLTHWQGGSRQRKINLYGSGTNIISDPTVDVDATTGVPALNLTFTGTGGAVNCVAEAYYDCGPGGPMVAVIYYDITSQGTDSGYQAYVGVVSDDIATLTGLSSDLMTGTNSSAVGTYTGGAYRFGSIGFLVTGTTPADGDHTMMCRRLEVRGNHGLTYQGTAGQGGYYASDVVANAVSRWAPLLAYSTGSNGTIQPTSFAIPQLVFTEATTASNIISETNKFHLNDWGVWEGQKPGQPTFYYGAKNTASPLPRKWRARIGPAQLQETGPQMDRVWNGVIVLYNDVDGTTKSVGPTGSPCDATDASLLDSDPLNPANERGIKRYVVLTMGITSTLTAATQVGYQFLTQSKLLDTSGSAQLVGHVMDDKGILRPAWQVRAGDQVSFIDASDTSYRRVVKTDYDHDSRTNSIDLDSPPQGLDDLLERLSVAVAALPPAPSSQSVPASTATTGDFNWAGANWGATWSW